MWWNNDDNEERPPHRSISIMRIAEEIERKEAAAAQGRDAAMSPAVDGGYNCYGQPFSATPSNYGSQRQGSYVPVVDGGLATSSTSNHRRQRYGSDVPVVDGGYNYYDQRFLATSSTSNHRSERQGYEVPAVDGGYNYYEQRLPKISPRNHWECSAPSTSPSSSTVLKNCGFCRRGLVPSRNDVYIYNDIAFCSEGCREQQIELDEGKSKNSYY